VSLGIAEHSKREPAGSRTARQAGHQRALRRYRHLRRSGGDGRPRTQRSQFGKPDFTLRWTNFRTAGQLANLPRVLAFSQSQQLFLPS
jgi:hypothetical protein